MILGFVEMTHIILISSSGVTQVDIAITWQSFPCFEKKPVKIMNSDLLKKFPCFKKKQLR